MNQFDRFAAAGSANSAGPLDATGPERPGRSGQDDDTLLIDCDRCLVRGPSACSDCVMNVVVGGPRTVEWDRAERNAVGVLADAGLVPPLRLVSGFEDGDHLGPESRRAG